MAEFIGWSAEDGVGRLTLQRPPLNVLNIAMLRELCAALEAAARVEALRVLILRAADSTRMFSAGVDVADHTADTVGEMIPLFDRVCQRLADFPAPTLAVVHGHALGGGCELALCCDLVIAVEGANFSQPEIRLATIAPIAALRLPALIGYRRSAEMLFTGEAVNALEAARLGLINHAVPADELDHVVTHYLGQLRGLSAPALRLCKRALRLGADGWANLPAVEKLYLDDLMDTADAREGVAAFLEKRSPTWRHT
jgi:cyclohexa-1,5-dienecarbonyl-CoA hydratase